MDNLIENTKKDFKLNSNLKRNCLILNCIARLVPQKSIENIIISLTYLNNINVKLIIVGNGPLKKELKKLSKKTQS